MARKFWAFSVIGNSAREFLPTVGFRDLVLFEAPKLPGAYL